MWDRQAPAPPVQHQLWGLHCPSHLPQHPWGQPGSGGHLEHGVGEEGLQGPLLTVGFGLVVLEQLVEVAVLLAVGQDLQAVLVVPHKLLVDVQHGQQDVEQVSCRQSRGCGWEAPAQPWEPGTAP